MEWQALLDDRRHDITNEAALRRAYPALPAEAALVKVADHLHPVYRPFVERAPFAVLATHGPRGLDTSPRGDRPGFIRVVDEHTLLLPDRRGNQRLDSLGNLLHDPQLALLLLIPGCGEALRINGHGRLTTQPGLCEALSEAGQAPASVLVIHIASVYFQCARAILRSGLWPIDAPGIGVPMPGQILKTLSAGRFDGDAYDAAVRPRQRGSLY